MRRALCAAQDDKRCVRQVLRSAQDDKRFAKQVLRSAQDDTLKKRADRRFGAQTQYPRTFPCLCSFRPRLLPEICRQRKHQKHEPDGDCDRSHHRPKFTSHEGGFSPRRASSLPCAASRWYSTERLCLNSSSLSTPVKITMSMGKLPGRRWVLTK